MKETFAYYEITPEIIEKLEDGKPYTVRLKTGNEKQIYGYNIKRLLKASDEILLPFSPPKDISDEEINKIGAKWLTNNGAEGRGKTFSYAYKLGRSELAGKQSDREFIIQKMNGLVNDISHGEIEDEAHRRSEIVWFMDGADWVNKKLKPRKQFIVEKMQNLVFDLLLFPTKSPEELESFINDWVDKNLMEGKEVKCDYSLHDHQVKNIGKCKKCDSTI